MLCGLLGVFVSAFGCARAGGRRVTPWLEVRTSRPTAHGMFELGNREDRYFTEVQGSWKPIGRTRESGLVEVTGDRAVIVWGEGLVPPGSKYAVLRSGETRVVPLPAGCSPFVPPVGERIDCVRSVSPGAAPNGATEFEIVSYDVSLRPLSSVRLAASSVEPGCRFWGLQLAGYDRSGTPFFPVQCPSDGKGPYRHILGAGRAGPETITAATGLSFHDAGDIRFWSRVAGRELLAPARFERVE